MCALFLKAKYGLPAWQRTILPALLDAAKALGRKKYVQIIAVTHSPLVLASLEGHFSARFDRVFTLDLVKDVVNPLKLDWRVCGDVSRWLTSEAFGLKEPRSREAERYIEDALEEFRKPEPSRTRLFGIGRHLRRYLNDTDPFWRRWNLALENEDLR